MKLCRSEYEVHIYIYTIYIYIYIYSRIIAKTKIVLDAGLLNTHNYKVRVKVKVEQSRELNSALSFTSV